MKFGHTLEEAAKARPDWAPYYVEYKQLKAVLTAMTHAAKGIQPSEATTPTMSTPKSKAKPLPDIAIRAVANILKDMEAAFIAMLEECITSINSFVRDQQRKHFLRREEITAMRSHTLSMENIRLVMQKEQELWKESDALRDFAALNHTAFFKILKKHDKMVRPLAEVLPPGTVNPSLAGTFMAHVEAQSFIRVLHNENPLDERVVDQPQLLQSYKDRLKEDLRTTYTLACSAMYDILPKEMQSHADTKDVARELQTMYDITIADVMSKIRVSTEAQLRLQIEKAKHRLFQRMVERIRSMMEQQFPEASHALMKIQRAHTSMFFDEEDDASAVGNTLTLYPNNPPDAQTTRSVTMSTLTPVIIPHRTTDVFPTVPPPINGMSTAIRTQATRLDLTGFSTGTPVTSGMESSPSVPNPGKAEGKAEGKADIDTDEDSPEINKMPSWMQRGSETATQLLRTAIKPVIPQVFSWAPSYKLARLKGDAIAALTLAAVSVPQGLAYAKLAEVDAIHGIYAMMFPAIMYALWGTSRQAGVGPQSIPALLIGTAVTSLTSDPNEKLGYVLSITLLVGLLCLVFGIVRLGFIVSFISTPVLNGFASAAAIITTVSVLKDWFRVTPVKATNVFVNLFNLLASLGHTHFPSLLLGVSAMIILVVLKRHPKTAKLPGALIVVVIFIVVMAIWHVAAHSVDTALPGGGMQTSDGVKIIGTVELVLPKPVMPSLSHLDDIFETAMFAMFVGFIESIAVAKMYSLANGYEIDASQELVALGTANIIGSMFQSIPAMAGFGLSAINSSAGAKSQFSLLMSGILVGVIVVALSKVIYFLPNPVLSSIIIMSVSKLVDFEGAKSLWKQDKSDLAVMGCSFFVTLVFGVQTGVTVAMLFSLGLFIWRSARPVVVELGRIYGSVAYAELGQEGVYKVHAAKIIRFGAPLYFANVSLLKDCVSSEIVKRKSLSPKFRWHGLLLDFSNISGVDSTAMSVLSDIVADFQSRGLRLVFANLPQAVRMRLVTGGLLAKLGESNVFNSIHDAVRSIVDEYEHKKRQDALRKQLESSESPLYLSKTTGKDGGGGSGGEIGTSSEVKHTGEPEIVAGTRPLVLSDNVMIAKGNSGSAIMQESSVQIRSDPLPLSSPTRRSPQEVGNGKDRLLTSAFSTTIDIAPLVPQQPDGSSGKQ